MNTSIVPQTDLDNFLAYLQVEGRIAFTEDGIDIFATQAEMADLFGVTVQAVARTIKNYEKEDPQGFPGFLNKMLNKSGVGRPVTTYNSDVLIYVGYRLHATEKATAFRRAIARMFRAHVSQRVKELQDQLADSHQVNRWLAETQGAGAFIKNSLPAGDRD